MVEAPSLLQIEWVGGLPTPSPDLATGDLALQFNG